MIAFKAVVKAIRTGWTTEQIHHWGISDILEATKAIKTTFVPVFATRLHRATFGLQCKNRPGTGRAVTLRTTIYCETLSAEERLDVGGVGRDGIQGTIWGKDSEANGAGMKR